MVDFIVELNKRSDIACKQLYHIYYAPLCSYSTRIIKDPFVAEDIVQESILKLWNSTIVVRDIRMLVAYLYKSVYNSSLNFIRDSKHFSEIEESIAMSMPDAEQVYMAMAVKEDVIGRLYAVIDILPKRQRDVMLLCVKGKKVAEIAETLAISENSVKTLKKRAYDLVREKIDISKFYQY